jgi:magnesium chelatase subunit I
MSISTLTIENNENIPSQISRGLIVASCGNACKSVPARLFGKNRRVNCTAERDPSLNRSDNSSDLQVKPVEKKKDQNQNMESNQKSSPSSSKNERAPSEQVRPVFPFTAIVGQEEMKLALILNVIDPKIGGVMIMGDRGTGKSTTVRALVDLLPDIEVVKNDPFNSDPYDLELMSQEVREKRNREERLETTKRKICMVDLPLGATEDRVCGTIDIEKALTEGVKAFEPGLLAKANRGILYVDEVNLLDDHLVDVLLDSAASGWNTVEREGISISHPARFILVGSGNPEEGELRPQLLDRFGMHAQIGTVKEPHLRVKIVEQRAQFDESPTLLRDQYAQSQDELTNKIKAARKLRSQVEMDYDLRMKVSEVCSELNVDGLRGDIVTNRASQAIAAFEERVNVTPQDIFRVIPLCLRHRLRKDPLESIDSGDKVKDVFKRVFGFN